jgi:hypothetical protein
MRSLARVVSGILVAAGLAACSDMLRVENRNNPDRRRVLATPSDLEALTAGAFQAMHQGSLGTDYYSGVGGIACHARAAAGEASSGFNNFGWNLRGGIPRVPVNNTRQSGASSEQAYDFNGESVAARTAADGLYAMGVAGISTGSAAQDARLRAFAWFTLGVAEGNLALVYDSAAIADPHADLAVIAGLSGYREVMAVALANLDSALAWTSVATAAAGGNGFPLPSTWINGSSVSAGQFIQLIRSYKAHFRADVARTRAEGDAVDWPQVLADASNGVTADLLITTQASPYWSVNLCGGIGGYGVQVYQLYAGMADTSGGFDVWLRAPLTSKVPFLVVTPDRRYPQGLTRAAQQANSPSAPSGVLYLRNRTTADLASVDEYATSLYEWYRFIAWAYTPGGGPYPVFSHNQNDMLQAEAYIRTGNIPAAAALIDIYRTRVGLPALAGVITALGQPVPGGTAADPVPGGASCVPRIPVGTGPEWTGSTCGDIWEAMKWEFRMENMFVGYAAWYFPARRWGDLPEGTPLHWPVPWQEMDARGHPFYNLGGVGGRDGVGKGTYGL